MLAAIFLLILTVFCPTRAQECPQVQASDLGNTSTPSRLGLISEATLIGDNSGSDSPNVQLLNFTVVCLAVGTTRDRYRFASVVTEYSCSGPVPASSSIPCNDSGTTVYSAQFDLECIGSGWSLAQSTLTVNLANTTGSLESSLTRQCSVCVEPTVATANFGLDVDNATHCAGKNQNQLLRSLISQQKSVMLFKFVTG